MSEQAKKNFWNTVNPNVLVTLTVTLVSWFAWGLFYVGAYKKEMDSYKTEITSLKTKIERMESQDNTEVLRGITADRAISGLDVRVTRLEEFVPKIAILTEQVNSIKITQQEMKSDTKEQLKEIKELVEKSLQK